MLSKNKERYNSQNSR